MDDACTPFIKNTNFDNFRILKNIHKIIFSWIGDSNGHGENQRKKSSPFMVSNQFFIGFSNNLKNQYI